MPRDCIIGGGPTGSREHIFPAALGGRRTNKGIYCGNHNNGFSRLAGSLASQLKVINSLLGVRSDHADKPHTFDFVAPDGEAWNITASGVSRNGPPTVENKNLHMSFTFGGSEGLKAITYVALTFFAHHFADDARKPQLRAVKDFIQGNGNNDFAWWERSEPVTGIPANVFEFGHTIALTTSAASGDVYAYVSLFSTLNFGVHLGTVNNAADRTVIVFIDPHAEHAPKDIVEHRLDTVAFNLAKPTPLYAQLERMVHEKSGEQSIQALFSKIEEWKFSKEMAPVLAYLNDCRTLSEDEQWRQVVDVVQEQTSMVYRLLVHFVRLYQAERNTGAHHAAAVKILNALVARNPADPTTLTPAATQATAIGMEAIARDIKANLDKGDLDMDYLWFLFSGTNGLKIAGEAVMAHLKDVAAKM